MPPMANQILHERPQGFKPWIEQGFIVAYFVNQLLRRRHPLEQKRMARCTVVTQILDAASEHHDLLLNGTQG